MAKRNYEDTVARCFRPASIDSYSEVVTRRASPTRGLGMQTLSLHSVVSSRRTALMYAATRCKVEQEQLEKSLPFSTITSMMDLDCFLRAVSRKRINDIP